MPREIQFWRGAGNTTSHEALPTSFGDGRWNGHTGVERGTSPDCITDSFLGMDTVRPAQGLSGGRRPNLSLIVLGMDTVRPTKGLSGERRPNCVADSFRDGYCEFASIKRIIFFHSIIVLNLLAKIRGSLQMVAKPTMRSTPRPTPTSQRPSAKKAARREPQTPA
jgi:hypothetical protein